MNRVDVGAIPIWLGTQKNPEMETAPFSFEIGKAGLIRMAENDIAARMIASYASDTYHFITSPPGASEWGNTLAEKSIAGLIATYGDVKGKRILEVGGGTLYSAQMLVNVHGAQHVTVIDPALGELQSNDERISLRAEYLTPATQFGEDFDLIISFNTLEHVPDPIEFLNILRSQIADTAQLYLKLPESGESLKIGDLGLCVHEHLSYFTPDSLDTCLTRAGFTRIASANYQGALQVLCRPSTPSADVNWDAGPELLACFAKNCGSHIDRLKTTVAGNDLRHIAFVGASVGLANFLELSRIATEISVGIFDNDDLKHGEFLPGIDVAIKAPTAGALAPYDGIFITPLNFFDEIRIDLQNSGATDGKPVNPVFMPADHG